MRISCEIDDPGYTEELAGIVILLDDQPQKNVIMADETTGEVLRVKVDEQGHAMAKDGFWVRERVMGRVEIYQVGMKH